MAVFNWSAKESLPRPGVVSNRLDYLADGTRPCSGLFSFGALKALDVIIIIFGAVLILNTLRQSGAMLRISNGFRHNNDRRLQAIIIVDVLRLSRGAAGFGAPPALAAPLLSGWFSSVGGGDDYSDLTGTSVSSGGRYPFERGQ